MFETALAIYKKDGDRQQTIAFDRETVEFKRLNDKVQQRREARAAAESAAHQERQRQRDYEWFCTMSFGHLIVRALILLLTGIWTADGIVPLWLSAAIAVYCICSALIRVGRWIEKARHQK